MQSSSVNKRVREAGWWVFSVGGRCISYSWAGSMRSVVSRTVSVIQLSQHNITALPRIYCDNFVSTEYVYKL